MSSSSQPPLQPTPSSNQLEVQEFVFQEPSSYVKTLRISTIFWLFGPWIAGIALGLVLPRHSHLPGPVIIDAASPMIGWTYFTAWSVSFYPQIVTNFKRKCVTGLSLDYQLLNILGFTCYSLYNCLLFWNPTVRRQYSEMHKGLDTIPVHLNDVVFALHALAATIISVWQCIVYEREGARPHKTSIYFVLIVTVLCTAWAIAISTVPQSITPCSRDACPPESVLTWLTWLYFLSIVKVIITFTKYLPQVVLNYRRRSTLGWNIWNVLLDFEGGVLSIIQQLMDAEALGQWWAPVVGNPAKFLLGLVSIIFDIIFMIQHFLLYPTSKRTSAAQLDMETTIGNNTEHQPLIN